MNKHLFKYVLDVLNSIIVTSRLLCGPYIHSIATIPGRQGLIIEIYENVSSKINRGSGWHIATVTVNERQQTVYYNSKYQINFIKQIKKFDIHRQDNDKSGKEFIMRGKKEFDQFALELNKYLLNRGKI